LTSLALEFEGKRLELLKEIAPRITRVAVLFNERHPGAGPQSAAAQAAAKQLGLSLQLVPVRAPADFDAAFEAMTREGAEAILTFPDGLIHRQAKVIAEFAGRRRIPSIGGWSIFVEAGNLLSYGPNEREFYRRAAAYVDRILRGAKPADLPVELPTRFELIVNQVTARALGLTMPRSILVRADRVIE
jgi:putative ABC transport system substrate-binding protein